MAQMKVSILGTGDFGRALGSRLIQHGYDVTYGSRNPEHRHIAAINPSLSDVTMTTIADAVAVSDVIFIAIPYHAHATLGELSDAFRDKIVVDVSNLDESNQGQSNAEKLAGLLPGATVVKAFNTVSAYKLENSSSGEGNTVYVASDSLVARERVLQIARTCSFIGLDYGRLSSAENLEAMPLVLCGDWLIPVIIAMVTSALWFVYIFLHYYIIPDPRRAWDKFPANVVNKFYGVEALTLLALCYIPGSLAAFVQIANGTKYKRFPAWLDYWLKSRKQLGLMALMLAAMHCILSIGMLNSAYYDDLFLTESMVIPANHTDDIIVAQDPQMNWKGETLISVGVLALTLMAILGITSIPAIGNLMNWRQWVFVQSYMGFLTLCVAEAHVMVRGTPGWPDKSIGELATSMTFMSSFLPYVAILLRLIILIPCVNGYVAKIRKGWERVPSDDGTTKGKHNSIGVERTTKHNNGVGKPINDEEAMHRNGGTHLENGHTNVSFTSEL